MTAERFAATVATRRVCIVVSHPGTIRNFLRFQLEELSRLYDVSVAVNADCRDLAFLPETIHCRSIRIERKPSPLRDLAAVWKLYRLFRRERFDAVHSMTPKAGLLTMLAASAARVPVRFHTFMGEVWATRVGSSRLLLKAFDRVTARLSTTVLVVSQSELGFLRGEGVLGQDEGRVLGSGSVAGVDLARFAPDDRVRARLRRELGLDDRAFVFLFLGRFNRDKGIGDLAGVWPPIASRWPLAHLLLVGEDEEGLVPLFSEMERAIVRGYTDRPERYINASDVLCLPSRREGLPVVVLESACSGLPCIASRIYGMSDAVVDGETGLLFPPADREALMSCMETLLADPLLRERLGTAAQVRVAREFSQERVAAELLRAYRSALDRSP